MKLEEILDVKEVKEYVLEVSGDISNIDIENIRNDSRQVEEGSLFVAVKGVNNDGINYVNQAREKGAVAIVVEEFININNYTYLELPIIKVRDVRKFVAYFSKVLYKDPTNRVPVIAVTGSKGKTTTCFVLREILLEKGYNVGTIGTVGVYINRDKVLELDNTTGESFQTNEIIYNMVKNGINIIILEVSSQSVVADRVEGMHFEYTCFTNFSEDHISVTEHPSMEEYYNAKIQIIEKSPVVILNMDDEEVRKANDILKDKKIVKYGYSDENDIIINKDSIDYTNKGTKFTLKYNSQERQFSTSMLGDIAVYNITCAIAIAKEFHIEDEIINKAIQKIYIEGRFNFIPNDLGIDIVIDYAHTEESLKQALLTFRGITKGKIIALWGLSGQRDKGKRPKMGKVSAELADITIVTTEDPRDEEPEDIAQDIVQGIKEVNGEYLIIHDRRLAIFKALEIAKPGDTVALLGKGQERSQIFKGEEIYLNEKEIVEEYLSKNKSE